MTNEAAERLRGMQETVMLDAGFTDADRADEYVAEFERSVRRATVERLTDERLVDVIEQAIFETDTGLAAALLATERIRAVLDEAAR